MKKRFLTLLFLFPLACAVPVPPTGGPPDQTPPSLVASTPENGSTLFSGTELTFEFDEAVDARTFTSAFTISPDIAGAPEISGWGKRLKVKLPETPRPETTYIITLESTLRDVHGVVLERPISIAFSTGKQIDKAQMSGKVVLHKNGEPASGIDVFAYANSDSSSLDGPPLYRTQSGKDGVFNFRSVAQQAYYVVAVEDRNRNRRIESTERMGIPPVEQLLADTLFTPLETPWILSVIDSDRPSLDRVRAISGRDIELRFSESLWLDGNQIASFASVASDSLDVIMVGSAQSLPVQLYFEERNPRILFARVDTLVPGDYTLRGTIAVSDSSRNQVASLDATFTVPETLPASKNPAFRGWVPDSAIVSTTIPRTIWPRELVGFRTTTPPNSGKNIPDAMLRDTSGFQIAARFDQVDPTLFVLREEGTFAFEKPFFVDVNMKSLGGQDSVITAAFVYASDKQLGAFSFTIDPTFPPSASPDDHYRTEFFGAKERSKAIFLSESPTPSVLLDKLPGGMSVFLRVSKGSGPFWNAGGLSPWSKPDPLAWIAPKERIRARWETVLPDTVSFKLPAPTASLGRSTSGIRSDSTSNN